MAQSLKERYQVRQVSLLKERLTTVEQDLRESNDRATLLIEAMSQEDLDKVSAIVRKLDTIRNAAGNELPVLTNAIEAAQSELNKYTAGGPIAAAWSKMKTKVGIDNPVVKVTTFASALEQGFRQLPQILKNNGIDLKQLANDGNVRLIDAVARQFDGTSKDTSKTRKPAPPPKPKKMGEDSQGGFSSVGPPTIDSKQIDAMHKSDTSKQTQAKVKTIIDQIKKALAPAGIFGAFKKIPYIDGAELATGLANAHVSVLNQVAQAVRGGPQTDEVAPDLKANVVGGGEAQTKSTGPSQPAKPSSQTSNSEPSKSTVGPTSSTNAGEVPPQGPGEKRGGGTTSRVQKLDPSSLQDLTNYIAKKIKVSPDVAGQVINALNDSEKLRN